MKNLLKKVALTLTLIMSIVSIPTFATTNNKISKPTIYEITVNDTVMEINEGEKVNIPLVSTMESRNMGVFPGNKGILTLTAFNGNVQYIITMYVPATSFSGFMNVRDISHGLDGGYTKIHGFIGSVKTSNLKGHTYSAYIDGTAYLGSIPVARTVSNSLVWKN